MNVNNQKSDAEIGVRGAAAPAPRTPISAIFPYLAGYGRTQ